MKRKIHCNECGRLLFETEKESNGAAGSEAQNKGFVFKMPFLFTDKYGCLFFCDQVCSKSFYGKNIPKNPEVTAKIAEIKADIPRMATEVCNRVAELQKTLIIKH